MLELCSSLEKSHISRPCKRWISYVWQGSNFHLFLLWMGQNPKDKQWFPCSSHWALSKVNSTQVITAVNLCFIPIIHVFIFNEWNLHAPCTLLMPLVCKIQNLLIFSPSRMTEGSYFFLLPSPLLNRKSVHIKYKNKEKFRNSESIDIEGITEAI